MSLAHVTSLISQLHKAIVMERDERYYKIIRWAEINETDKALWCERCVSTLWDEREAGRQTWKSLIQGEFVL